MRTPQNRHHDRNCAHHLDHRAGGGFDPGDPHADPVQATQLAVKSGALHEIKSPLILQPGPAALTDGLAALQAIIANAISLKTGTCSQSA